MFRGNFRKAFRRLTKWFFEIPDDFQGNYSNLASFWGLPKEHEEVSKEFLRKIMLFYDETYTYKYQPM